MYELISVPLDRTPDSRHALPTAVDVARRANCPIELVHVAFPPAVGTELYGAAVLRGQDIEAVRREAEEELRRIAGEVERFGVLARPVALVGGSPAKTLADHLRESETDLVVMTTHDRGRLEHVLLGSVAESVVRRARVPVLLLKAREGAPELDRPVEIRNLLIPLDGSAFAAQIIQPATELARLLGAELSLVSVLAPVPAAAGAATAAGRGDGGAMPLAEGDDARPPNAELLERTAEPLRAQGLTVYTTALVDERPAHAIIDYATQHRIHVIAMTTHGRGALKRLVAGSVSQEVLRMWPGPMLMYRPEPH